MRDQGVRQERFGWYELAVAVAAVEVALGQSVDDVVHSVLREVVKFLVVSHEVVQ